MKWKRNRERKFFEIEMIISRGLLGSKCNMILELFVCSANHKIYLAIRASSKETAVSALPQSQNVSCV